MRMRYDDGLDQRGGSGEGKLAMDESYVFNVKPAGNAVN